jgi:polyhydroxybutyrate depolymerase
MCYSPRWFLVLMAFTALHLSGLAQTTLIFSFPFDGINRNCRLYVPAIYDGLAQVPLVIDLHGFGGNGASEQSYTKMNLVADTAGFLVAYPTGAFNAWNAGAYYASTTTEDDLGYLSALMDSIGSRFAVDPRRVYMCGISNGGDMSITAGCFLSERIAAIGPVAGTMLTDVYATCDPTYPMPVAHLHGTKDLISNIGGGPGWEPLTKTMRLWAAANGCPSPSFSNLPNPVSDDGSAVRLFTSDCSNGAELNLFLIKNGGHTWPGTAATYIDYLFYGYTNQDIDGSSELWRFFRRHSRPEAPLFTRQSAPQSIHTRGVLTSFPQPATGRVDVQNSTIADGPVQYQLTAQDGRLISVNTGSWSGGFLQGGLDASNWDAGTYLLSVVTAMGVWTTRIIRLDH